MQTATQVRRTLVFNMFGIPWPQTIEPTDPWGMVETLESLGSVVTTMSTIGMTIVKGA